MSLLRLLRNWYSYWFTPIPTTSLELFRIFFGLLVFQYALCALANVHDFIGPHSLVSFATARAHAKWEAQVYAHYNIFEALYPYIFSDAFMTAAVLLLAAAAVCLSLGFFTRWNAFIVYTLLCATIYRDPFVHHSGHNFMRILSFLLFLSPAGTALSIDALLNRKFKWRTSTGKLRAAWPQRLMQFMCAFIYCQATTTKLTGSTWTSLNAVYMVLQAPGFKYHELPFISYYPVSQALTLLTLLTEIGLFTLVWFDETRYWMLAVGVVFHGIIAYTMNIPQFEEVMVIAYFTFVKPEDAQHLLDWCKRLFVHWLRRLGPRVSAATVTAPDR